MSDQPMGRGRARNFLKPGTSGNPPRVMDPGSSSTSERAAQPSQQQQRQPTASLATGMPPPTALAPAAMTHGGVSGFTHRGTNRPVIKSSPYGSGNNQDRQVNLLANYVKVRVNPRIIIYQYHVDFSVRVVNPETRSFLIQSKADVFRNAYIYDKQNTIMSTTQLVQLPFVFTEKLNVNKETQVMVRLVREISIDDEQMMHFFNAQLRMNMEKLDFVQILKNFYDFDQRSHLQEHKLEIIPGMVATIKNCKEGILMGLDTIHKVIHLKTCLDVITEMKQAGRTYYERELVGSIVLTRYNNRTYRICALDRTQTPLTEFDKAGGEKTNYVEYYGSNYNITIRDHNQPLLMAVPSNFEKKQKSKKLFLVPELCFITGLTPSMQNNFNLKRLLLQKAQLSPQERIKRYNDFLNAINSKQQVQQELEKWHIAYGSDLLNVQGTQLAPEAIITQDQLNFNQATADFSRELRGKTMFKSCNLSNWHVICIENELRSVDTFLEHCKELTRNFGIDYRPPHVVYSASDTARAFLNAANTIEHSQLIMLVLPNNHKPTYDDIKKRLCCEIGFPSQCVLSRTLWKRNMSISTKLVIQIAVKVGAEPWVLSIDPKLEDVMVVGFDVYRDKSKRRKSVGGFVASLNATFSAWFSKINFHQKTEETSDQFATSMGAALRAYHKRNNKYPSKILVIRDGVSEGQYTFTIENELEQLKQRVRQTNIDCKVTFMCINKRIMTRFFRQDDGLDNPVSGTVVDHTIVNAHIPQFFLVSQSTTQGTVSPTSYDILQDNIGWPLVEYQRLVYKLCHLYYNWTGLISVPAPCQYAHKLAYLAGGSFEKPFKEELAEKLFFL